MKNHKLELTMTLLVSILVISASVVMIVYATCMLQMILGFIFILISIVSIPFTYVLWVVLKKAFKEILK